MPYFWISLKYLLQFIIIIIIIIIINIIIFYLYNSWYYFIICCIIQKFIALYKLSCRVFIHLFQTLFKQFSVDLFINKWGFWKYFRKKVKILMNKK